MGLEIEVKVAVADPQIWQIIQGMGASLVRPRHFEDNMVFDFPEGRLRSQGQLLRVRMVDGDASLTFKGTRQDHPKLKVREELEIKVEDGKTLAAILERLGFVQVFRYQKYRTEYLLPAEAPEEYVYIMVDETPMGNYLELEGEEQAVLDAARRLGFKENELINKTYSELYAEFCCKNDLAFGNMTFEEAASHKSTRGASNTASAP